MAKKTAMEIVRENEDKIRPRYELTLGELRDLVHSNDGIYTTIANAYVLGYVKGQKAEKARRAART